VGIGKGKECGGKGGRKEIGVEGSIMKEGLELE
jgi:hypothetical protein